jgi:gamma-polyglutamate biosynthesis protein CapC
MHLIELGLVRVGDRYEPRRWLALVEAEGPDRRGFGAAILAPGARGPVLVVPQPASEAPVAELAVLACRRVDCRAILVAGVEHRKPGTRVHPHPLELAMAAFADSPLVILRGHAAPDRQARVHPLRGYVDVSGLWPAHSSERILDWRAPPTSVRLPAGAAKVALVDTSTAQLEALLLAGVGELVDDLRTTTAGYEQLLELLSERYAERPTPAAHPAYTPPSSAELFWLEQEIVEPLLAWARTGVAGPPPGMVTLAAELLDYQLIELGSCDAASPCAIMLRERTRPVEAGWGTLVVRRGRAGLATTVEVPRPLHEVETWRVGAELWQLSEAEALLIADMDQPVLGSAGVTSSTSTSASATPWLRPSPDPVRPGNLETAFQAIHQGIDRRSNRGRAREVVQIRGLAASRAIDRDVILGLGRPAGEGEVHRSCWTTLDPRLATLISVWGSCRVADGSADLYPLSGAGTPQLEYSRELRNREIRVVWLSAGLRDRFRPRDALAQQRGLRQAGFDPQPRSELDELLAPVAPLVVPEPAQIREFQRAGELVFERAVSLAVAFAETGNLHAIRGLRELAAAHPQLRVTAGLGQAWGRPYLLVEGIERGSGSRALISLDPQLAGHVVLDHAQLLPNPDADGRAQLRAAALARPQVLSVVGIPLAEGTVQPGARRGRVERGARRPGTRR